MEPPTGLHCDDIRDEQVKVFRTIPPLDPKHLVRGQFNGYKKEKGVAPESNVETFAAVRLEVQSWRWSGVPFLIRAGKCLPATTTEVLVKLRKPPLDILGISYISLLPCHGRRHIDFQIRLNLDPFMIHETFLYLTETAFGSHPCRVVSATYRTLLSRR